MKRHPDVGGSLWSAIVGVYTGVLALVLVPVALTLGPLNGGRGAVGPDAGAFVVVAAALGIAVSWGGTWLWNGASSRLPTTLAGLLITVETISGYTYAYILDTRLPPVRELMGFVLVIAGVVVVARLSPRRGHDPVATAGDGV